MTTTWKPSFWGKLFTRSEDWTVKIVKGGLLLNLGQQSAAPLPLEGLQVVKGAFWARLEAKDKENRTYALKGIPTSEAIALQQALIKQRSLIVASQWLKTITDWAAGFRETIELEHRRRGWITREVRQRLEITKPKGLQKQWVTPEVSEFLKRRLPSDQQDLELWTSDLQARINVENQRHLAKELVESKTFLDSVEKSPLTQEQAKSVICFDNRVLLVASAGSGKTSTMVAKAGYALKKGYFAADRMLLLAFNSDAAEELGERIRKRLEPLGLPAVSIVAKTFHAFGLEIIGRATGKKPSVAPWVVKDHEAVKALLEMADHLKDTDSQFRTNWDLFRLVFAQDLPSFGKEEENPDRWDSATKTAGFWTLNGEVVKSRGELLIANWLFYNGVNYVYERAYPHDTADATHSQYHPDFYFPDVDVYLEHWALDADGKPPESFVGYLDGIVWKRKTHTTYKTKLLETTTAELWSGKAFSYLERELTKLGIALDPNPDRPARGRQPIENPRLAGVFRMFLTHVKSNRLTLAELRGRLQSGMAGRFRFRHEMFLNVFEALSAEWERRLKQAGYIDFEDMLNMATDFIERGQWTSPYELVMVDEFQDSSYARGRLIKALVDKPDRFLFAVGDDWQSINRFAGSDLSVMSGFEKTFGESVILKLETTFRCPQSLCDISSQFVQKNPKQLKKGVRSATPDVQEPVLILQVEEENQIRGVIEEHIQNLARQSPGDRKVTIFLLGRYRKDSAYMPHRYDASKVEVKFVTAHSSKGLEADYVILPRVTSEILGFPSGVADDPVLQLAMPDGDAFEYAEERRLFYVALTRARKKVCIVTLGHRASPFITELVKDHGLSMQDTKGETMSKDNVCPACKKGFMVKRSGAYGDFFSCSTFPACQHKFNAGSGRQTTRRTSQAKTGRAVSARRVP